MNNPVDALNQKVSLIYEYNNRSPLFVRAAGIEIEKNNLDSAIGILDEGIKHFPENPVAFILLGKAHTIKGNYTEALSLIKKGSGLINSVRTFNYYVNEIETIKKQRSFFNISRWSNLTSDKPESDEKVPAVNRPVSNEEIEETLTKLTAEIEGAERSLREAKNKIEESTDPNYVNMNTIISETLAKIYSNQNEFQAAISVYKKLIKKFPDKEQYFVSKIEELKSSLRDQ